MTLNNLNCNVNTRYKYLLTTSYEKRMQNWATHHNCKNLETSFLMTFTQQNNLTFNGKLWRIACQLPKTFVHDSSTTVHGWTWRQKIIWNQNRWPWSWVTCFTIILKIVQPWCKCQINENRNVSFIQVILRWLTNLKCNLFAEWCEIYV